MRIAVWHNLPSGGGKRALYGHVAGLVRRGHQVEAWCPDTADESYLPLKAIISERRLPLAAAYNAQLSFRDRLRRKLTLGDARLAAMDAHSAECAAEILSGNFDVILVAPCRFYLVPRLRHFLSQRPPTVLYLQEPCRGRYEALPELPWLAPVPPEVSPPLIRRLRSAATDMLRVRELRHAARREIADACLYNVILVNSYFSRESISRAYGLESRVCYLGYDDNVFRWLNLSRENFVMGLGSMDYIKGVDTCIEALATIPKPLRPHLIWVANSGNETYRYEMEALAARLNVTLRIEWQVSDERVVDLLNRTKMLIYTSRLEPFGYAPIEANACGAPVVAVAEGGVRETIEHGTNGLLCSRDIGEIGTAISSLLQDEAEVLRLGAHGMRISAERWNADEGISRLEAELHRAISLKTGTPRSKAILNS